MKKILYSNSVLAITFLISVIYSVIRYNIFKGVDWSDLPLYVMNKAIALTSIILFALYQYIKVKSNDKEGERIKEYAIILITLHIIISAIIISPQYFAKFYSGSQFNLTGGLSVLFGVVSFGVLLLIKSRKIFVETKNRKWVKKIIANIFFILIGAHVFVIGYSSWLEPGKWPGGMPPISLLSFVITISAVSLRNR